MSRAPRILAHPAAVPLPAALRSPRATPERSRRLYPWSCPATGGRSGVRWGSRRRCRGAFSVGPPLGSPTFLTRAITSARGRTIPQTPINTPCKWIPLLGSRRAGPAGRSGSCGVSGGRSAPFPRVVRRTATARGVAGSVVGRCVGRKRAQEGAGLPSPPWAPTRADL